MFLAVYYNEFSRQCHTHTNNTVGADVLLRKMKLLVTLDECI